MPIKKLTFSFDVPLTSLLSLIAAGQADMRIDVLGDDRPVPLSKLLAANGVAGLLEGPKKGRGVQTVDANGKKTTALTIILAAMAKAPGHVCTTEELKPHLAEVGLQAKSVSPQVADGQKKGWFERVERATYKLTAVGVAECQRRGIEVSQPPDDKPPKAAKLAKAATHAPVKSNGATHHG